MVLITTREAAKRLGISDRRIRQLIAEGRIKAIKVGRYNLIEESDCHYERKPRGGHKPRKK
jgi:excisionase family DNA binding protein